MAKKTTKKAAPKKATKKATSKKAAPKKATKKAAPKKAAPKKAAKKAPAKKTLKSLKTTVKTIKGKGESVIKRVDMDRGH